MLAKIKAMEIETLMEMEMEMEGRMLHQSNKISLFSRGFKDYNKVLKLSGTPFQVILSLSLQWHGIVHTVNSML